MEVKLPTKRLQDFEWSGYHCHSFYIVMSYFTVGGVFAGVVVVAVVVIVVV